MIRGLYTGASGMLASQTQSEIIADNISNAQVAGYKEAEAINKAFPDMLLERTNLLNGVPDKAVIGTMGTGVLVDRISRNDIAGVLQKTDIKTDLALTTEGYFAVNTPNGERYTRNGHFQLNADGILQTADGYAIQGVNGQIGPLSDQFTINSDGMIIDNGQIIDRLRVVGIPEGLVQREGQSLYNSELPVQDLQGLIDVKQGAIESSTVDISRQMVKMITVMRAYEANQRVLQTQDTTLEKAVNEIAKV